MIHVPLLDNVYGSFLVDTVFLVSTSPRLSRLSVFRISVAVAAA